MTLADPCITFDPQHCTTLWSMVLSTKFSSHRAFVSNLTLADPWWPYPLAKFYLNTKHDETHSRTPLYTHTHTHTHPPPYLLIYRRRLDILVIWISWICMQEYRLLVISHLRLKYSSHEACGYHLLWMKERKNDSGHSTNCMFIFCGHFFKVMGKVLPFAFSRTPNRPMSHFYLNWLIEIKCILTTITVRPS